MGATDPSGLGGLTPTYGYCKLKKDGVEPNDEHNWTSSCESNSDCMNGKVKLIAHDTVSRIRNDA